MPSIRTPATTALLALATTALFLCSGAAAAQFRGYLADILCVDLIIAVDGANMITNPQGHSVGCALLPPCAASGFTILSKPSPGQTTYGPMYNFTADSNAKAIAFLRSLHAVQPMRGSIDVTVEGTIVAGGKLQIAADIINDHGWPTDVARYFDGYLVDRRSLDAVVAADGANLKEQPEKHTIAGLKTDEARASGYALLLPKKAADPGYGAVYNFTAAANDVAWQWLSSQAATRSNVTVRVYASVDAAAHMNLHASPKDGVVRIEDLDPVSHPSGGAAQAALGALALLIAVLAAL